MRTRPVKLARTRDEVWEMYREAIDLKEQWFEYWENTELSTRDNAQALRNYTALRGVVKALLWVLSPQGKTPLE